MRVQMNEKNFHFKREDFSFPLLFSLFSPREWRDDVQKSKKKGKERDNESKENY